jgi:hypothetical protein
MIEIVYCKGMMKIIKLIEYIIKSSALGTPDTKFSEDTIFSTQIHRDFFNFKAQTATKSEGVILKHRVLHCLLRSHNDHKIAVRHIASAFDATM